MSLRLLLILSGSLEILAGFLALISPPPVVSLSLGMPMDGIAAVLTRLLARGVLVGMASLKAQDDVQSPAGLVVNFGSFPKACLQPWIFFGLQQGRSWAACYRGEQGLFIQFSACYSCPSSRGRDNNRTERGLADRALCMNQHL